MITIRNMSATGILLDTRIFCFDYGYQGVEKNSENRNLGFI